MRVKSEKTAGFERRVREAVRRIPRGRIATYGQVASLAGRPRNSRQVGRILGGVRPGEKIPWHRVVNAQGKISPRAEPRGTEALQRTLLEAEGVAFTRSGRIRMADHAWDPALAEFLGLKAKRVRMP